MQRPFFNEKSTGPADGMEKSYQEIMNVLTLLEREDLKQVRLSRIDGIYAV